MNITILTIGTRGDVQPFVALGAGFRRAGHEVTLATGRGFEGFVTEHGLRHASLDVDLLERVQPPEGKAAVSGKELLGTLKKAASMHRRVFDQEWAASQETDVIVYHPKALGGYHIAEALGVPGFLAHLARFLANGPPPVYVGFGSLGAWTSDKVITVTLDALERTGQRGVFATGGGQTPSNVPDDVCVIQSAPHDWLFPRMAAVVHHGGAGTTAEGLRAGKPTLICPTSVNDQAFWGRRVFEAGVGPRPIPQRRLTIEALARAIHGLVTDGGMRKRAEELGEKIRAEQGVARAVGIIE